jgi:hypothetical protein
MKILHFKVFQQTARLRLLGIIEADTLHARELVDIVPIRPIRLAVGASVKSGDLS